MTKNILIGLLSALCVVLLIFGMIQRTEVKRQEYLAKEQIILALKNREEAQKLQQLAEQNALEARRQSQIAEARLIECAKRKK